MSLTETPPADHRTHRPPREIIEDSMRARLAMAVGDLMAEASVSGQYRILSGLSIDGLGVLLAGCRAEIGPRTRDRCAWCCSNTHLELACPEMPVDIALALYES